MRAWKKVLIGSMTAGSLAVIGATGVSHSAHAAPLDTGLLSYHISGLPSDKTVTIVYSGGVASNTGGSAQAKSGSMAFVHFLSNHSLEVQSSHNSVLTADVNETVVIDAPAITGDADIPSGASVKVLPPDSDTFVDLSQGHFSIPTGR